MEDLKRSRVTIIVVSAIVLFFLINFFVRYLLGFGGVAVSLIVAVVIAAYISWSVARALGRVPTSEERSRALWFYIGFLGALFLAWGLYVSLLAGFDGAAVAILLLHFLPYPALAQLFLTDRFVRKFLKNKETPER
ncbi:hypothetical protein [Marinobacter changyiensis]|uniref:hypothetical protein n=1 Tax=Marinobacter changyiensis TaxID=2604091 RepID=UPI001265A962|nr:hypothetical protein [Marinobacter changyiensis]